MILIKNPMAAISSSRKTPNETNENIIPGRKQQMEQRV